MTTKLPPSSEMTAEQRATLKKHSALMADYTAEHAKREKRPFPPPNMTPQQRSTLIEELKGWLVAGDSMRYAWDYTVEEFGEPCELYEPLKALMCLGEVTFDWGQHEISRKTKPTFPTKVSDYDFCMEFGQERRVWRNVYGDPFSIHAKTYEHLPASLQDTAKRMDERGLDGGMCYHCGERLDFDMDFETLTLTIRSPECAYPEGHPEYGPTIDVPDGTIIFADDMFSPRPDEMEEHGPSDSVLWAKGATMGMGRIDVAHGFCGNSCPTLYVSDDGNTVLVANPAYTTDEDGHCDEEIVLKGHTELGSVITDLWWWTIADKTIATKKAEELKAHLDYQGEAQIKPGRWQIFCRYHMEDRDDYSTPSVFARLEYRGPIVPDPTTKS